MRRRRHWAWRSEEGIGHRDSSCGVAAREVERRRVGEPRLPPAPAMCNGAEGIEGEEVESELGRGAESEDARR